MEKNSGQYPEIDPQKLVAAFQIMRQNIGQSNLIADANLYFRQCEKNPQFASILINLFHEAGDQKILRQQILGLLKNVIIRNWTLKRRTSHQCYMSEQIKERIRNDVLQLYKIYWKDYYKLFNQIFQQIAKQDFPNNYPSLYEFIAHVLNTLSTFQLQQILASQQLLPYLSTVKTILKSYGKRRILHNAQQYTQSFQPIIKISSSIFEKIGLALNSIASSQMGEIDQKLVRNLLECSKKIDKIIMYGIESMPAENQKSELVIGLAKMLTMKMSFLVGLLGSMQNFREETEKNILALMEGLSKMQTLYPFVFAPFLRQYLRFLVNILFSMNFQDVRLINETIKANRKPLQTYSYYMLPQDFQQSIYCVKGNSSIYTVEQQQCFNAFREIYGGNSASAILQECVSNLMVKYVRQNEQDEMIFEDAEPEREQAASEDVMPFDLIVQFVKNLIQRFKEQVRVFLKNVCEHLMKNMVITDTSPIIMAMHEIILMLPKIDKNLIDLHIVYSLMEKAYQIGDFKIFPRYIRSYYSILSEEILQKSFQILASIIPSEQVPPRVIYQCAFCIKKLLENDEIIYPLMTMSSCMSNIFKLLRIYKNDPNHLWNLLHLINQLLEALSNEAILNSIPLMMENLGMMITQQDNTVVTLEAITDLLENIVEIMSIEKTQKQIELSYKVNEMCIQHIGETHRIFSNSEEGMGAANLYKLWLAVMKNHDSRHSTPEFNKKLGEVYQYLEEQALNEEPILLCEILEEYILSKVFVLSQEDMINVFRKIKGQKEVQNQSRIFVALYSVYYTYSLVSNTYTPDLVANCMQDLRTITNHISTRENALRTQLMVIISHHLLVFGQGNIFGLFSNIWPNYIDWFWPIVWGLDYINYRFARKIVGIALLHSLECFSDENLRNLIEGHMPIDYIVKFLLNCMEPVQYQQAVINSVSAIRMIMHTDDSIIKKNRARNNGVKGAGRKALLHINKEWSEMDLQGLFREKLGNLWKKWDWGVDDLQQRYCQSDCTKILAILS